MLNSTMSNGVVSLRYNTTLLNLKENMFWHPCCHPHLNENAETELYLCIVTVIRAVIENISKKNNNSERC